VKATDREFDVDVVGRICTACGVCTQVCPRSVFSLEKNRAVASMPDECDGCMVCVENCPSSAIAVKRRKPRPAASR